GPWLFAGSVIAGHGKHHTRRSIHLSDSPFYATSEHRSKHAAMGLRTSYVYAQPHWYVTPFVDLAATCHGVPAHGEGGAGPRNLRYDKADETSLLISPAIEMGGRYDLGHTTLRPYASAGVAWLSQAGWDIQARLEGVP